jgi:hypothetical protein
MIISYRLSNSPNYTIDSYYDMVKGYSKLCANYNKLPAEEKIKVQISKYHVWKVEINSIKRLIKSEKITDIEKLLLEDQQNILQKEAWGCREEIYRLYHKELPQNDQGADKFLEKIEGEHIILEMPVTKCNIGFEKYVSLSPIEKIRLLISQSNMLEMELFALAMRRESLKMHEYESLFLNYRIDILKKCISRISLSITITFYKEFKRDTPGMEKYYEEILRKGSEILHSRYKFLGKEECRYPYDFKRPNEVPTDEWGSPEIDWKTGDEIPYEKRHYT